MTDTLDDRIAEARAVLERLERMKEARSCAEGHSWISLGGCNAGCNENCNCSVPVYECAVCGDCDYGRNEEADAVRRECAERKLMGTADD